MDITTTVITELKFSGNEVAGQVAITDEKLSECKIQYLCIDDNQTKTLHLREDQLRFLTNSFIDIIKIIDEKRLPKRQEPCTTNSTSE